MSQEVEAKTGASICLSQQQQQALAQLHEFLQSPERLFVLEGYAGTGKTTLLQAFVSELQEQGDRREIVFSAFTNKATKVLAQMVDDWGLKVECLTCCQLLGLQPQIDPETGEQEFVVDLDVENSFGKYALVVIDECSMINKNLWEQLLTESYKFALTTQVLFVGDSAQLPPINEVASQTFIAITNKVQLTEVVRYGGAIGLLAESIRTHLDDRHLPRLHTNLNTDQTEGTIVTRPWDWEKLLLRAFKSDLAQSDSNYVRALAYTNKRVRALNLRIRSTIFGDHTLRFVPGERLIAMGPVFAAKDEIVMQTSAECWVEDVQEAEVGGWRIWALQVKTEEDRYLDLRVLHKSEQQRLTQTLDQLAQAKQWQEFWLLKQQRFANVNYSYALTVHKSQGSTFTNVFVDVQDVMRNRNVRERNQLLYVAVTRAAKRLFVNGP